MNSSPYLSDEGNKYRVNAMSIKTKDRFKILKNNYTNEEILEFLKIDGYSIKFVSNPTDEMLETAYNTNKFSIMYMKRQTTYIINDVITNEPHCLIYLQDITMDIIKEMIEIFGISNYININVIDKDIILKKVPAYHSLMAKIIKQKNSLDNKYFLEILEAYLKPYKTMKKFTWESDRILSYFKKDLQCDELALAAIKINWENYKHYKGSSPEVLKECLKYNPNRFEKLASFNLSNSDILKINGLALEHIKDPTHEEILIALHSNSRAIKFVKNQTDEYCKIAVLDNGLTIRNITNQTEEICLMAVLQNETAITLIKDQNLRSIVREKHKQIKNKGMVVETQVKEVTDRLNLITQINKKINLFIKHIGSNTYTLNDIVIYIKDKVNKKHPFDIMTLECIIISQIKLVFFK